ncbi:hypothetical protein [Anaerobacterium chartisolvens]|nr:hypothetical protein [Anaerobacterium chartisolvens]
MIMKNKKLLEYQVKQFGFFNEADRQSLEKDFMLLIVGSLDRIYGRVV